MVKSSVRRPYDPTVPRKRELHDAYFRKAKAEGYVARSAYKLLQIEERRHLIRRGHRVIDLGCAPGSWLQVASKIVGADGRVLGVDLQPSMIDLPNVRTVVADAFKLDPKELTELLGGKADVLLSDMAPNTTGTPKGDHFRSVTLCRRVLELAPGLLERDGGLVIKVFEGEAYMDLLAEVAAQFTVARGFKPHATREMSREMFIQAWGYAGDQGRGDQATSGKPAVRIPPHKRDMMTGKPLVQAPSARGEQASSESKATSRARKAKK